MKIQPGRANKRPRTDETSGEAMDLANKHSELELENKRLKSQLRDTRVQLKKLRNQLQDARDEVKELTAKSRDQREQIICLKQEISAERDAPDYPTDYELGQDFQSLNSSIQAWAFGAMRDSKRGMFTRPEQN
ncbi:hypothetical protein K461DRAFT_126793 [Myriangium duriaei CBS 260.36]|uniref:Uncharacterized protein n=1 Tax=Myriangium duriaei CBS 260.36 TaxID=1168546 RepID=A0A9P4J6X6_9PEZI|nr:hypothetical protein K461DRAFT_126793 [Myriangium duriaei CBS 260.36]